MQWLRWRQGLRLRGVALGLSMAGQAKLAERVMSGWRVRRCSWSPFACMHLVIYTSPGTSLFFRRKGRWSAPMSS